MSVRGIIQSEPYYINAVRWAYENGITNGTTETTFEPDRPITRAELVTMLWRMNGSPESSSRTPFVDVEPEPTPLSTPRVIPKPPKVEHVIHEEYAPYYYGRMYIGEDYSVGLYDTLDQELVDMSDAAFFARFAERSCMIGDHDSEGLWIVRYIEIGTIMRIERRDGTVDTYVLQHDDPHVSNTGYDVIDRNGESCLRKGYDLLIATCNDSTGVDMTATFWDRVDSGDTDAVTESVNDGNAELPMCWEGSRWMS